MRPVRPRSLTAVRAARRQQDRRYREPGCHAGTLRTRAERPPASARALRPEPPPPRAQNQFDCLDLSDNEIKKVECLAVLPRLKMLLLNNNRITRIAENLGRVLPGLETLILANNQLSTLKELEPLAGLPALTTLSLMDNIVTKQLNYRPFVIALLPKLRVLDFKKVKPAERKAAAEQYSSTGGAAAAPATREQAPSNTFQPGEELRAVAPKAKPTAEQIGLIKEAIANAGSLEEVATYEKALKSGNYEQIAAQIAAQKAKREGGADGAEGGAEGAPADEPMDTA